MSNVINPGTEAEARAILGSDGTPVLVDFYAEWCGPCKAFAPTLERFAEENPDSVRVMKLDIDEFTGSAGGGLHLALVDYQCESRRQSEQLFLFVIGVPK